MSAAERKRKHPYIGMVTAATMSVPAEQVDLIERLNQANAYQGGREFRGEALTAFSMALEAMKGGQWRLDEWKPDPAHFIFSRPSENCAQGKRRLTLTEEDTAIAEFMTGISPQFKPREFQMEAEKILLLGICVLAEWMIRSRKAHREAGCKVPYLPGEHVEDDEMPYVPAAQEVGLPAARTVQIIDFVAVRAQFDAVSGN